MQRLYLYLASRSKAGIKLIAILQGSSPVSSRLTDLTKLGLPPVWQNKIVKIAQDNRFLYEPWIESANSYEDLKQKLSERGFTNLPIGAVPMLSIQKFNEIPKADTSSCKIRTTMVRKKD